MNIPFLESLVAKVSQPQEVIIEYKFYDQHAEPEDYSEFDIYTEL